MRLVFSLRESNNVKRGIYYSFEEGCGVFVWRYSRNPEEKGRNVMVDESCPPLVVVSCHVSCLFNRYFFSSSFSPFQFQIVVVVQSPWSWDTLQYSIVFLNQKHYI